MDILEKVDIVAKLRTKHLKLKEWNSDIEAARLKIADHKFDCLVHISMMQDDILKNAIDNKVSPLDFMRSFIPSMHQTFFQKLDEQQLLKLFAFLIESNTQEMKSIEEQISSLLTTPGQ